MATAKKTDATTIVPAKKASAKKVKAPAVKKGQEWASNDGERLGRVTGFDKTKVNPLAILEPVSGMTRGTRVAVTTLQKKWTLKSSAT